jgi:hypothetical protein
MTEEEAAALDRLVEEEQRTTPLAEVSRASVLRGLVVEKIAARGLDKPEAKRRGKA